MADQAFTLEHKISESATTTVYRAYQEALDRRVLLKVLHKHLTADKDFVARFRREARACAAIHSENIVQVYDLTEIDGAPAIVMEFVEGRSLKEILEKEGKKPVDFVQAVMKEVLQGLAIAHSKGIIHRDIKPGNILVSNSGAIKVTDFGLAFVPRSPTLTLDGMVLGTPAYMSPEQARGEVVDARADLFSLGVTIFELLTSERIFEGESYSDCMKRILSFSPKSVEAHLADLPSDFSNFVRRLLAPRKEDRFTSAEEALRSLMGGKEQVYDTRKRMDLRPVAVAGLVLLALIVVLIAVFTPRREGKSAMPIPDTSRTSEKTVGTIDTLHRPLQGIPARENNSTVNPLIAAASQPAPESDSTFAGNDSGIVVIKCQPWGMIYVNNVYLGQTPLARAVPVKAGNATVTFSNPLFVPITRNINVPRNARIVVEEDFLRNAGYLMIRVVPWAEIYIDDLYRDTTPLSKPMIASVGTRRIRLHNPSYDDVVYDAAIEKSDTLNLSFNLPERKRQ